MNEQSDQDVDTIAYGKSSHELRASLQYSFDDIVSLLSVLSHPNRFKISILLLDGPQTFKTLLQEIGLRKSALSSHISQLREKALIRKLSHGTYELTDDGISYLRAIALMFDKSVNLEISRQRMQAARSFLERDRER